MFDAWFVTLVILAVAKAALAHGLATGDASVLGAAALEVAGVVLVLGVADLLPPRRSYAVDLIAYTLLSVLMLANLVYASFFGQIVNVHLLGSLQEAGQVRDSIASLMRPTYALFIADIPFLIAWAVVRRKRRAGLSARGGRSRGVAIATVVAACVFAVQLALVLRLPATTDSLAAGREIGLGAYQVASLVPGAGDGAAAAAMGVDANSAEGAPATGAQVQRTIEALRGSTQGARLARFAPGSYRGKHVIVVQVESLQTDVVGKKIDGKEITPNLNRLVAESWYWPNGFSQTGSGNTADAEFALNTGLYPPLDRQPASVKWGAKQLSALPRLLQSEGYDTATFHANHVTFWNRDQLYPALGFRQYYDAAFFKDSDKMWHASDEAFFAMSRSVLASMTASDRPIYANFVTMTSHNPFRYPQKKSRRPVRLSAEEERSTVGGYIGSISYADKALGQMLQALKADGLYEDSIIVVFGDHTAMARSKLTGMDARLMSRLLGREYTDADRQRIPVLVHLPGQKQPEVVRSTAAQVDIMPTIADALGVDLSATPHVGRSLFVAAPGLAVIRAYLPAGTAVNDRVVLEPGLGFDDAKAFAMTDGSRRGRSPADRRWFDAAAKLGAISDAWLESLPRRTDADEQQDKGFQ